MRFPRPSQVTVFLVLPKLTPKAPAKASGPIRAALPPNDWEGFSEEDQTVDLEEVIRELEEAERQMDQEGQSE